MPLLLSVDWNTSSYGTRLGIVQVSFSHGNGGTPAQERPLQTIAAVRTKRQPEHSFNGTAQANTAPIRMSRLLA